MMRVVIAFVLLLAAPVYAWNGIFGGAGGATGATGPIGPTGASGSPTLTCDATPGQLHSCTVHLNASQVNTLHTISPVTLVAAPGSGKVLSPLSIQIEHKFGTLPFCIDSLGNVWATIDPSSVPGVVHASGTITAAGSPPTQQLAMGGFAGEFSSIGYATSAVGAVSFPGPWFYNTQGANNAFASAVANLPLTLNAQLDPGGCGAINTSAVAAAGSAYVVGDEPIVACASSNSDAKVHIDTVNGGSGVTGYHLVPAPVTGGTITGGTWYFVGSDNPCPTTGGSGTGFQVNVNSTTPGNGDVYVTVLYSVIGLH